MSYSAYIVELKNVRPHGNADRLQLASCMGDIVVVGLGQKEGDLGVYFPTDGQLSHEFCVANNLYSKSAVQKLGLPAPSGYGFFDHHRRVRAQTFRGEKSEGFWLPISALDYLGPRTSVAVGDSFTEWDGHPICNRYETPITREGGLRGPANRSDKKGELLGFPKHYDTKQFRYEADQIPLGSLIYVTEKLHGTSHRVGLVGLHSGKTWWKSLLGIGETIDYRVQHGTRNVVLGASSGQGYYGSDEFRFRTLEGLNENVLRKGEVVYGELVGFYDIAQPIMPRVTVPKDLDDVLKQYGPQITYSYGCTEYECQFYVYRIVQFNEDGHGVDLSWPQVKRRCEQMGLKYVPELTPPFFHKEGDNTSLIVDGLAVGHSVLDKGHLREGVAVRVETLDGHIYTLKHKSFEFKVLEGIIKLSDEAFDIEEAS